MKDPMQFEDDNEVLAVVRASMGRRILGLGSLGLLGILLIYIAIVQSPAPSAQIFLIAVGTGALWLADTMRRATSSTVELTPIMLRDADGTMIARVADVISLDRGAFAFKPSNGFLLKVDAADGRIWRPGLWWRIGGRIGIGGMTPGPQTKYMSEILSALMIQRDAAKNQDDL